ncbi:neuropeptide Y receptor type 2 [Tupaia chinensis]|uniref:Neuropeptide Y receptor type 2 n=1 Tax=Tupaia chinensis TaxID=246437 RepID=L8Y903_TUPCH|nr:neuropeptide Y receptor type 2 [Tupaia chinensis]ELV12732.1 Neuropeptide Y receptor type 2 [Tupaia chinensis]
MGPAGTGTQENQTVQEMKAEQPKPGQAIARGALGPEPEPELIDSTRLVEVRVALILAYCSIILLGVVGNSLVIYVVIRFKSMRTVTNFFIANLALADLLVSTLCLPFTLVYTLMGEWRMGAVLCHLVPYAQGLAVQVSTITLTVIALDRRRCIVYHLESRISKRASLLLIGLAWGTSALLASPLAIFREYSLVEIVPDLEIAACTEKWPGEGRHAYSTVYSLCSLLVLYVLPLGLISVSYVQIWARLRRSSGPGATGDRHRRRRRATQMLASVVAVFAVCWLPLHAFQLAVDIDSQVLHLREYKLVFTVLHVVAMCPTFANPLLYGWMNSNYRRAFLAAFHCAPRLDTCSEVSVTLRATKNLQVRKSDGPHGSFSEAANV